jgi:hypothetical protein
MVHCREPLLFVIALCEGYRVNVGWANPTSENFNTLRVSALSRIATPIKCVMPSV